MENWKNKFISKWCLPKKYNLLSTYSTGT